MAALREIGDIRVFAEIHRGATTTVYKGFQTSTDRVVLLKVLRPEFSQNEKLFRRFQGEAKIIAKIKHPNVVAMYEYGRNEEWSYFATEFVEGLNLDELIHRNKIPPDLAWFILSEITKGLQAAHQKGILHKDLKPANILISVKGEVKLADFGMADLRESVEKEGRDEVKGTLGYLSPEQILGENQGRYSDIFSLGATFYEMLSGTPAFFGKTADQYFKAILNDEPLGFLKSDKKIPDALVGICGKMLSKKFRERYQSCSDILLALKNFQKIQKLSVGANDLASYLEDPKSYSPVRLNSHAENGPIKKTNNYRAYAAGLLAVLILMGLGYFTLFSGKHGGELQVAKVATADSLEVESGNNAGFTRSDISLNQPIAGRPPISETDNSVPEIRKETSENSDLLPSENLNPDSVKRVRANVGFLKLSCTPWAYIFIDADSIGTTPLPDSLALTPGSHKILFRNPDFPDYETTLDIVSDSVRLYQFSMWSLVGKLSLEISPWAEVFIDGEYRDTIPPQERPLIIEPGSHSLALRHPDLGNFETGFKISANENLNLRFNLRNLLAPEGQK